jgi:hypothetical protein
MITPEPHAEIRRLYFGEHWKVGTIVTNLGVPDTVRAAIALDTRVVRRGACRRSILDPYLPSPERMVRCCGGTDGSRRVFSHRRATIAEHHEGARGAWRPRRRGDPREMNRSTTQDAKPAKPPSSAWPLDVRTDADTWIYWCLVDGELKLAMRSTRPPPSTPVSSEAASPTVPAGIFSHCGRDAVV